jgi:large subunit ribosomal protein L17
MRHRKNKATLDRTSYQRAVLLRNLANSLVHHEKIVTTPAKARITRSLVERLITLAKKPTLHSRRQMISALNDPTTAEKILTKLGPRYLTRPGGYTRMTKVSSRQGDQAEQVMIEFV